MKNQGGVKHCVRCGNILNPMDLYQTAYGEIDGKKKKAYFCCQCADQSLIEWVETFEAISEVANYVPTEEDGEID
jgi:hypothetical protein